MLWRPYFFLVFTAIILVPFRLFSQHPPQKKTLYYPDGKVSSRGFLDKNGTPVGRWSSYHPNGIVMSEGDRTKGVLEGLWKFYDTRGRLTLSVPYKKGRKQGLQQAFFRGVLIQKIPYVAGIREGASDRFHANGKRAERVYYKNGHRVGKSLSYDTTGARVSKISYYEDDLLVRSVPVNRYDGKGLKKGLWVWFYTNENMRLEGTYLSGKKHGFFRYYDSDGSFLRVEYYLHGVLQVENLQASKLEIRRTFFRNKELKTYKIFRRGTPDGMHKIYNQKGQVTDATLYRLGKVKAKGKGLDSLGAKENEWQIYYDTGALYAEGAFLAGKKHGLWTYYYREGSEMAKGNYQSGLKNRSWHFYYPNSKIAIVENYKFGAKEGTYTEYTPQGKKSVEGLYENDLKEGFWMRTVGDIKDRTPFKEGEKHGLSIWYSGKNRRVFEGDFLEGSPEGRHVFFLEKGSPSQARHYRQGLQEGEETYYDREGVPIFSNRYSSGDLIDIGGYPLP